MVLWGCTMSKAKKEKVVIGWREFIAIPELKVKEIKAKIDTGARTSALHVTNLEIEKSGNAKYANFVVHPDQNSSKPSFKNRHRVHEFKIVKSSNGESSKRPVILVEAHFGKLVKEIKVTLVNRDLMGFRMLIGRTAMTQDFIVDPQKSFLLSTKKKVKK